jgi:anti-sigma factor ChrR (cupin superfamily)
MARGVSSLSEPDPLPAYPRTELQNLHRIAEWQDEIAWEPFGDGVEIHRLYGDGVTGATAALIRFRQAGTVRLHEHAGYEHILVLAGSQSDQNGTSPVGSLVINPPGSRHSIISESGCIVLAIYEKPVVFLPADTAA